MKQHRQEVILDIISSEVIDKQETLIKRLLERGFNVTQATVSRDIKNLRISKRVDENGSVRYAVSERMNLEKSLFIDAVTGVDYALNTVVLKCMNGTAQAACAVLDTMGHKEIVGTIAGDDTIFILMRTENNASSFVKNLKSQLGL